MLTTRHDTPLSDEEWRTFLATQDFGQLVVAGLGRDVPLTVPAHYRYDPGANAIELHLHRGNPVWAALAENPRVVFAVVDAHVYVPTHWNADPGTDPEWSAPTSYYAAVQAIGTAEIVDEPHALAGLLTRQMRQMQPEGGYARVEPGPSPFGRMLKGILGLRLEVAEVRAKFKFGGNKSYEHRCAIAEQLVERGTPADLRAREYLLRRRGGASTEPLPGSAG